MLDNSQLLLLCDLEHKVLRGLLAQHHLDIGDKLTWSAESPLLSFLRPQQYGNGTLPYVTLGQLPKG